MIYFFSLIISFVALFWTFRSLWYRLVCMDTKQKLCRTTNYLLDCTHGVRGTVLLWIENFLSNRTLQTRVEVSLSDVVSLLSGVVQGSGIGPVQIISKNVWSAIIPLVPPKFIWYANIISVQLDGSIDQRIIMQSVANISCRGISFFIWFFIS